MSGLTGTTYIALPDFNFSLITDLREGDFVLSYDEINLCLVQTQIKSIAITKDIKTIIHFSMQMMNDIVYISCSPDKMWYSNNIFETIEAIPMRGNISCFHNQSIIHRTAGLKSIAYDYNNDGFLLYDLICEPYTSYFANQFLCNRS